MYYLFVFLGTQKKMAATLLALELKILAGIDG